MDEDNRVKNKLGEVVASSTQAIGPSDTNIGDSTRAAGQMPTIAVDRSKTTQRVIAVVQLVTDEQKSAHISDKAE